MPHLGNCGGAGLREQCPLLRKTVYTLRLQCNSTKMPACVYPIIHELAVDGEVVHKPVCILLGPVLCIPPALLAF